MTSLNTKLHPHNPNTNSLNNLSPQQQTTIIPTRIRSIAPPIPLRKDPEVINRLKKMVRKNVAYNGGLHEMSHRHLTDTISKQSFLPTGKRVQHYNELKLALNDADISMKKLEKHQLKDFLPNLDPPKYEAAINDLQQAINAQYELERALRLYGKSVTGDISTCCILRAEDCERRISEMLNVVSQAHIPAPQRNNINLSKNIAESMDEYAPDMHGTPHVLQKIYADAKILFAELDSLERNKNRKVENYKNLENKILRLQKKLTSIQSQNISDTGFKISYDVVLLDSLNNSLTSALERCKAIESPSINTIQENTIQQLVQPTITSLIKINNEIQHLSIPDKGAIAHIINYTKIIKSNLQAKAMQPDGLRDLNSIYDLTQQMTNYIYKWLSYLEPHLDRKNFTKIAHCIDTSIYGDAGYDVFSTGLDELIILTEKNNSSDRVCTGPYLAHAFYNSSEIDTLIECYFRDIPPQYIEKESSEKELLQDRTLGSGNANEVTLCVYKASHGQHSIEKVFKPEYPGRYGLKTLAAHRMNNNDFTHIFVRNVASSQVAKYLGCQNIVSSATAGTHKNQFGLFMNKAPGKTPADLVTSNRNNTCDLEEVIRTSIAHGNFNIMKANLRRELSNLEWADVLSGQIDRHGQNYLVDIDGHTGNVTVTGIDNDTSFSTAMTGVGIISVDNLNITPKERAKLEPYFSKNSLGKLYLDSNNSPIINIHEIDNIGQYLVRSIMGVNQKIVPDMIDKKTYGALMAIDETEYAETLANLLPSENVQVALKRLDAAKKYALELHKNNLVIDNWQDPIVEDYYNEAMLNYENKVNNHINYPCNGGLELPLYLRDFHYTISTTTI